MRRALRLDANCHLLRRAGFSGVALARRCERGAQAVALACQLHAALLKCSLTFELSIQARTAFTHIRLVAGQVSLDLHQLIRDPRDALRNLLRPGTNILVRTAHAHQVVVQAIDCRVQLVATGIQGSEPRSRRGESGLQGCHGVFLPGNGVRQPAKFLFTFDDAGMSGIAAGDPHPGAPQPDPAARDYRPARLE